MENKQIVSTKVIVSSLIGYWLVWEIVFYFVYKVIMNLVLKNVDSVFVSGLSAVILQGIIAIIVWKISTSFAFNKKTILYNDVPNVMKKLIIFTIAICVLNGISNLLQVNSAVDKAVESDFQLKMSERMMPYLYDDDQMNEYQNKKNNMINETKNKLYIYLTILEVGLTVTYLAVLPIEKKELLKYVIR